VRREGWDRDQREAERVRRNNLTRERRRRGKEVLAKERDHQYPVGPLARLLRDLRLEFGSLNTIAQSAGVDEAQLRRCVKGTKKYIGRKAIDNILVAVGRPDAFATLYPFDEHEGAPKPRRARSVGRAQSVDDGENSGHEQHDQKRDDELDPEVVQGER
jgi:hypothetical protein